MNMDDTYKFSFDDEWKDEMQDAVRQEPEAFADGDLDLEFYDPNRLSVVSGEELADMRLEPVRFCVEGLLPEGLSILGGAPKACPSWAGRRRRASPGWCWIWGSGSPGESRSGGFRRDGATCSTSVWRTASTGSRTG